MNDDAMAQIEGLVGNGYALYLQRNHMGACYADLSRGWWPFKMRMRINLDRQQFETAKGLLGDNPKRRVKLLRG
jgi:hypothetical protein